ncbi:hypothetical protein Acr_15g0002050 [Actinidia rufa]|uniref:Uncharacterized protein n=1 Tax=Actinidia rufa TaxID=165716 RepID=A0A7J0FSB1_9ERIC|nr:hypothetical protein Acr_15g0002050 [Actinidia rufa]
MSDVVNNLPSSPREDPPEESPPPDKSSDHMEDPEMDTCSPLEKEINVMTQGDLDRLREEYSFLGSRPGSLKRVRRYCLLALAK